MGDLRIEYQEGEEHFGNWWKVNFNTDLEYAVRGDEVDFVLFTSEERAREYAKLNADELDSAFEKRALRQQQDDALLIGGEDETE